MKKRHTFTYMQNGVSYKVIGTANDHGLASDMDIDYVLNPQGCNIIADLYQFDVMDDIQAEADREAVALFPEPTEEETKEYWENNSKL